MFRKLIAFLMAMIMVLSCVPVSLAEEESDLVIDTVQNTDIVLIPDVKETVQLSPDDISVIPLTDNRLESLKALVEQSAEETEIQRGAVQTMKKGRALMAAPMSKGASPEEPVKETFTGYAAYDISLNGENDADSYIVNVNLNSSPITLIEAEDAKIDSVSFVLYHIHQDEDDNVQIDAIKESDGLDVTRNDEQVTGFSFPVSDFSDFVLKYTVEYHIVTYYTAASGETYRITLDYSEYKDEAGIPEGAELVVNEILPEDSDYEAHLADSADKLGFSSENVTYARFFDITIRADGQEIQPLKPVRVSISLADLPADDAEIAVVHFGENGPETVNGVTVTEEGYSFEAESFSVYGVIVEPTPSGANDLDGRMVKMFNNGYFLGNQNVDGGPRGISKTSNESEAAVWTFESAGGDSLYYISTIVNGEKQYIHISAYNDAQGNAFLSDEPQALKVYSNNGNYVIEGYDNRTYHLNHWNNGRDDRFCAYNYYYSGDAQMAFTFTQPVLENNEQYMVIVKSGEDYYIVLNDGTLATAEYDETTGKVKVNNPMMWYYDGNHIYHHTKEAGFTWQNLPSAYFYRYIDPSSSTGLSDDTLVVNDQWVVQDSSLNNVGYNDHYWNGGYPGREITWRALMNTAALTYSDHRLKSANSDWYIGINPDTLKLIGQQEAGNAAEIYLAKIADVPIAQNKNHTVNHIDISIEGGASLDVSLAYGDYYYYVNGERKTLTVDGDHNVTLNLEYEQVPIEPSDMKNAQITAYSNKSGVLPDAFYITGYSGNKGNTISTPQVRIEGSFKVADLEPYEGVYVEGDYDQGMTAEQLQARLDNRIYYTVTVTKELEFKWLYEITDDQGNKQKVQLLDASGKELSSHSTVNLSKSFDYWDEDNECPPIKEINPSVIVPIWQEGHIIYDTTGELGSGMDFKLEAHGHGTASTMAIEITKTLLTDTGEVLHPKSAVTNEFVVYQNRNAGQDDFNSVVGIGVDNYIDWTEPTSGYNGIHAKSVTVGQSGEGVVYDYDVKSGMTYIKENADSINREIVDTNGKRWQYVRTYVDTEYAWRKDGDENQLHHANGVVSIPEVLGSYVADGWWQESKTFANSDEANSFVNYIGNNSHYRGVQDPEQQNDGKWIVRYETEQASNNFLPFFVYNVYKRSDDYVDLPVTKTWDDFAGSEYSWTATFTLQYMERRVSGDATNTAVTEWTNYTDPDNGNQAVTITLEKPSGVNQWNVTGSFGELPKFREDENGNKYERQYSAEETSFEVRKNGQLLYGYNGTNYTFGNGADETVIYRPFYDHDANEDWDGDWSLEISNSVGQKIEPRKIDIEIRKTWEPEVPADASATFTLKRYVQTEWVDYANEISNANIDVQLRKDGAYVSNVLTKSGKKVYIDAVFAPHQTGTLTFEYGGQTYTVTNDTDSDNKVSVRSDPITVSGKDGGTVVVNMTGGNLSWLAEGTSYNLRITDHTPGNSPAVDGTYSDTVTMPLTGKTGAETWQYTFEDLPVEAGEWNPAGTRAEITIYSYYLEETPVTGYSCTMTDSAGNEISSDNRIYNNETVDAVNTRKTGTLTISKTVDNDSASTKEFSFAVTVTKEDGATPYVGTAWLDAAKTVPITFDENGGYTATVQAGESLTIYGLPTGFHYTVTENQGTDTAYTLVSVDGDPDETSSTGVIGDDPSTAAFVNRRNVELRILKTVQDGNGNTLALETGTTTQVHVYQHDQTLSTDTELTDPDSPVTVSVGTDGEGEISYSNVTGGTFADPAYYNIAEIADSVADQLTAADGTIWVYDRSRVETEYVWRRNNQDSVHITPESGEYNKQTEDGLFWGYPEILGEYYSDYYPEGYTYEGVHRTGEEFNSRLDFHIYNVYVPKTYPVYLRKADAAATDGAGIAGAKFDLYGPYTSAETAAAGFDPVQSAKKLNGSDIVTTTGSVEIGNLGDGIYYLIETEAPADYQPLEGPIVITVDSRKEATGIQNVVSFTQPYSAAAGIVAYVNGSGTDASYHQMTVTNEHLGELTITKTVEGDGSDQAPDGTYKYTVRVSTTVGGTTKYVTWNSTARKYELTTDSESTLEVTNKTNLVIPGLPVSFQGVKLVYKVEEVSPGNVPVSGYLPVQADGTVETVSNIRFTTDTATAGLVNVYKLTRLTISKSMNVNPSDHTFSFTVKVNNADGTLYTGDAWLDAEKTDANKITFNENGEYPARIQAGESLTIYGLPAGCTYSISETPEEGYLLVSVNGSPNETAGAGTIGASNSASFVNQEVVKVTVDKKWKNSDGTDMEWPEGVKVTIQLRNNKYPAVNCTLPDAEGHTSHTFENLPKYDEDGALITYEAVETDVAFANKADYVVSYVKDTSVPGNDVIHFTNTLKPGALSVTKAVTVDGQPISAEETSGRKTLADGTYRFTIAGPAEHTGTGAINVEKTITITNGQANTATIENLVPGDYTVTEIADSNGTTLTGRTGGTNNDGTGMVIHVAPGSTVMQNIATFTNNINTTSLKVSKTVVSPVSADTNKVFTFEVEVTRQNGEKLEGVFGNHTFTGGKTTVQTRGSQTVTISDLPRNATYTVKETTNSDFTASAPQVSGTLGDGIAEAAFTNTRITGSLIVTKELKGNGTDAAPEGTYSYPIYVTTTIGGTKYWVQADGSSYILVTSPVTLNVTNGTPLTVSNLPVTDGGTALEYTVEEVQIGTVSIQGYTHVTADEVTTEKVEHLTITDEPKTAGLVNVYERDKGGLSIYKQATVNGGSSNLALTNGEYTFTVSNRAAVNAGTCTGPITEKTVVVTLTGGDITTVKVDGVSVAPENGKAVIRGLPTGTYFVTEEPDTSGKGMRLTSDNNISVTVKKDNETNIPTASFTNDLQVGSLTISKEVKVGSADGADITTLTDLRQYAADGVYKFGVYKEDGTTPAVRANGTTVEPLEITIEKGRTKTAARVDYLLPGTYIVKEISGDNPAVEKDPTEYTLKIEANEQGVITERVKSATAQNVLQVGSLTVTKQTLRTVNNDETTTYEPLETNVNFPVTISVVLNDKTYYVQNQDGALDVNAPATSLQVSSKAGESLVISNLPYGTYKIEEDNPQGVEIPHYSYTRVDGRSVPGVSQEVKETNDTDTAKLVNVYVEHGKWTPGVLKQKNGISYNGTEFTFKITEITDSSSTYTRTVTDSDYGSVSFPTIDYDSEGTYKYRIEEVPGEHQDFIDYDSTVFYLQVVVRAVTNTAGELTGYDTVGTYYSDEACTQQLDSTPTFRNWDKGTLTITKKVQESGSGSSLTAGEDKEYKVSIRVVQNGTTKFVSDTDGTLVTVSAGEEIPTLTVTAAGDPLVIRNLRYGEYTISEVDPGSVEIENYHYVSGSSITGMSVVLGAPGDPDHSASGAATLVNVYARDKGKISIEKTVTINGVTVPRTTWVDGEYSFRITSNQGTTPATTKNLHLTLVNGEITLVTGDGSLVNGKAVVSDLPTGTYKVEEILTAAQKAKGISFTVTGQDNVAVSVVKDDTTDIHFINDIQTGSLRIAKTAKVGSFTASDLTDARKNLADGIYTFIVFANERATIRATIADGETEVPPIKIGIQDGRMVKVGEDGRIALDDNGQAVPIEYVEVEDLLPGDYYIAETAPDNSPVSLDSGIHKVTVYGKNSSKPVETATAVNTRPLGSLIVTKKIQSTKKTGETMTQTPSYPVTVTVTLDGQTYYVQDQYGSLGTDAPNPSLKVKTGEPLRIDNLPYGRYTVTEIDPDTVEVEGYSYIPVTGISHSDGSDSVADQHTAQVDLVNVYTQDDEWTPWVTKQRNETKYTSTGEEFSYTITGESENARGYSETVHASDNGIVVFPTIQYSWKDDGQTFVYKIVENPGNDEYITYDPAPVYAVAKVTTVNGAMSVSHQYYKKYTGENSDTNEVWTEPTFWNYDQGSLKITKAIHSTSGETISQTPEYPIIVSVLLHGTTYYVADTNGTLEPTVPENPGYYLTVTAGTDLIINHLPYGDYVVTEYYPENVPVQNYAYVEVEGQSISRGSATVGKDSEAGVDLSNWYERDKGSLIIEKNVTVNGNTVPGTTLVDGDYEFTVTSDQGVTPSASVNMKLTISGGVVTAIKEVSTTGDPAPAVSLNSSNHKVTVGNLPTGGYTVTETLNTTQTGKGITANSSSQSTVSVPVTVNKDTATSVPPTATFVNNIVVGSLKITKTAKIGETEATDVTNARKNLADGTYVFGVFTDQSAETRATRSDGSAVGEYEVVIRDGRIVSAAEVEDLLPGPYYVKEIRRQINTGDNRQIDLDPTVYPVTVDGGKTGDAVTAIASVTNTVPLGSLIVRKTIQSTSPENMSATPEYPVVISVKLNNQTYYVQSSDGKLGTSRPTEPLKVTAGTDLTITGLPYGDYTVSEISPETVPVTGYSWVTTTGSKDTAEDVPVGSTAGTAGLVNMYTRDTSWTPRIQKLLNGSVYTGSEFVFKIRKYGENEFFETVTEANGGTVTFSPITYHASDAGHEFKYEIQEIEGSDANIAYDLTSIYAKVVVTNDGGTLKTDVKYYKDKGFSNEWTAPTISNAELGTLQITKTVTGTYTPGSDETYPIAIRNGNQYVKVRDGSSGEKIYDGLSSVNPGIRIGADQPLTIIRVPAGHYTVSEEEVSGEAISETGYEITTTYAVNGTAAAAGATNADADVTKGGTEQVGINNHYRDAGLVITKTISGVTPAAAAALITIQVVDADNHVLLNKKLTEAPFTVSGSTYTATLKSTDPEYAQYLVPDGVYKVTETVVEPDQYSLTESTYAVTATTDVSDDAESGKGYTFRLTDADTSSGRIEYTNVYEKPTPPKKEETGATRNGKPLTGNYSGTGTLGGVKVGDRITYRISYRNYKMTTASIAVTDTIDKNVTFVSADMKNAGGSRVATQTKTSDGGETVYIWTVIDVPAGTEGEILLTVEVTENALESNNGPGKVDNGGSDATVKVGNDTAYTLDYVENPVPEEPHKEETIPYQGTGTLDGVHVGDEITYRITYRNYRKEAANIIVTDTLDKNVEFVSANMEHAGGEAETAKKLNDDGETVYTWTVKNVPAGEECEILLTVKVKKEAQVFNGGPGKVDNGGGDATVQVGNDSAFTLDYVENPVPEEPHKKETGATRNGTPLTGNYSGTGTLGGVKPGDHITYQITYKNHKPTVADIIVTDTLDKYVDFVSVNLDKAGSTDIKTDKSTSDKGETVYTWTVKNVPAGKECEILLTVAVKEDALESNGGPGKVDNGGDDATVKIGNEKAYKLDYVENPVPEEPHKEETGATRNGTPLTGNYSGNGTLGGVKAGDRITYKISYRNYRKETGDIVVKDTLDKYVEFVSANLEKAGSGVVETGTSTSGGETVYTWTVKNVPAGKECEILLTVAVKEEALESNGGPGKVDNGGDDATVQVGNDSAFTLDYVENPVPEEPEKQEVTPYEGTGVLGGVKVGEQITYEISYRNYKSEAATVTIRDTLDKNVKFESADRGGKETDGVVTWKLENIPAGEAGKVSLTVTVLASAQKSNGGSGKVVNGGDSTTVQVGNDHEYTVETVENPVPEEPHKQEITPYEGTGVLGGVKVGEQITYEISYRNYKNEAATVTIKDTLDKNVKFESADNGGKETDGVVTWKLENVPAGEAGKVSLTVTVLEGAQKSNNGPGKVVNGGDSTTVQVGNDNEYTVETVENPVPEEPHKQEVTPYEGTGVLGGVKVGEQITYEISYRNYKSEAATVTIRDTLDKNVKFESADNGGKETDGVVTWKLENIPAGEAGKVSLTVTVLASAQKSNGGPGKVVNGGDSTTVQVGNDNEYTVETVENPVPEEPEKQEVTPYEGTGVLGGVKVGEQITYEISYRNYKNEAATVTIRDTLDKNVKFESADNGGKESDGVVTWKLENIPAGEAGKVSLTVTVLASAQKSNGGPGKVVNGGDSTTVQVGNDNEYTVETVENPVPEEPHKQEVAPYEGNGVLGGVKVGDRITYEITYRNYKSEAAMVTIKDKLDKNVEFVSASNGGKETDGVVTWTLENVTAGKEGTVTLTVTVLEGAQKSNGGPGKVVNDGDTATVQVGNDNEFTLDTVENPVPDEPHKQEITPYEGNGVLGGVHVGDRITYEISYRNYKSEAATVTIKDKLDENVEFVSASNGGKETDGIVTWKLENVAAGKEGTVTLTVNVLPGAQKSNGGSGKVVNDGNTATVQVGNDSEFTLDTVENPVPDEPHKQEITPYEGNGVLGGVKVGDRITYEISYRNYKNEAATVTIKDKLDKNVEFVSASNGGKETDGVVTWKMENVPAGKEGKVTLTVTVLEGAQQSNGGPGKAVNGGDTATVQVGYDSEFTLDTVENPVPDEPHKQEITPYKGNGVLGEVKVGDRITYEISYRNYKSEAATVTIKDKLDANVEFVSANRNGKLADGVVTWKLENVPAGEAGKVTLTVTVQEGAQKSNNGPGKVVNGGDTATVQVGNDNEFTLETVENPVPDEPESFRPEKKETAPYKGNGVLGGVKAGDQITYEITYRNYKSEAADIVIKDKLDRNVEFVSASNGGKAVNGTVTWTLENVAVGKEGKVTLTVKVLPGALASKGGPGKVVNDGDTATVKVGNDHEFTLDTVENPVPEEPVKRETEPYKGTGVLGSVKPGAHITYEIYYRNYKNEAADIVIRDTLDKNAKFVSASDGGTLINGTVIWRLTDVPAGAEGKVTLTVKVRIEALESRGGPGKVINGGDTATVKVGNDKVFTLNTVENPLREETTTTTTETTTTPETPEEETVSVTVRKVWDDDNNAEGLRPASVQVTLSNGDSVWLSEANGWQATVDGLPKNTADGQEIPYTWTEHEVSGYRLTGTETNGTVTTFTNTLTAIPRIPDGYKKPRKPGGHFTEMEEYDTALGIDIIINHVGDCFD